MQFLNNIPSDFKLTQYFKPYYELYSVKTLPTQLAVDRWFVQDCFGSKHYPSRAVAEKICKRFKSIYKLR